MPGLQPAAESAAARNSGGRWAQFFAEHECAPVAGPVAIWAFDRTSGAPRPTWNVMGTVFGHCDSPDARCMLLTTEPPPPPGCGSIWLSPQRARHMRNDLLRALSADDGGAAWLIVAGIAFTVSEAQAIERVLDGCIELMEAAA